MGNSHELKAKLLNLLLCTVSIGGTFALFASVPLVSRIVPAGQPPLAEHWRTPAGPFINL